ncbi:MAG: UbiA family prenyltransferase [Thermoplasmata archaeon]
MRRREEILRLTPYVQTLVILLGVPFWIISVGCVYLGWAIATRRILPDPELTAALVIVSVFITGSTFAYNDYADRDLDRTNLRKKNSLLVWGLIEPRAVLRLSVVLAALGILLSLLINATFAAMMGLCVLLSILYSNPRVKLKSRGGWDLLVNMVGIGVVLPLAGWSVARPVQEFPVLYLPSIFLGIGALYILTTLADYKTDKASGVCSVVVRLGKGAAVGLGLAFLVLDTISLLLIGYFNYLVPWSIMRLLWPPLVAQWVIYYFLIIRGGATYKNVIRTILLLAGIYIVDTGIFLLMFCGVPSVPGWS